MTRRAAIVVAGALAGCASLAAGRQSHDTAAAGHQQENPMESPKRRIPVVAPVEADGIRYEVLRGARARGFRQNGGIIAAIDVASGQELWTLLVYETAYDASEEVDVQDRYITGMRLSDEPKRLLVHAEGNRAYKIRLDRGRGVVLP